MPNEKLTVDFNIEEVLAAIDDGASLGMEAAADHIVNEMRRRAPVQTTQLRESINHLGVEGSWVGGTLNVTVSAGAPYARYVEEGTRPHPIDPVSAKALRWEGAGGYVFAKHVNHPGTKAQPFFFPAVEENREYIADQIGRAVRRALRNLGRK